MQQNNIPALDLHYGANKVEFAIRSADEIRHQFGNERERPHRHNYYTVLWSKNSCGTHVVDYKEYSMEPNTIFFITPGQVHQVNHSGEPDVTVLLFTENFLNTHSISCSFISDLGLFSEIADSPPIRISSKTSNSLSLITDKILESFHGEHQYKFEEIGAYLKLFLIECNKHAHKSKSDNDQTLQSARNIVKLFKDMLEENFTTEHKVGFYAKKLAITTDYLNSLVKAAIGKTAKELIQQRIVLEAKRFGLHTQLSSKEIAYNLGFEDPSHFSKFFKNVEKISFTEFRQALEVPA